MTDTKLRSQRAENMAKFLRFRRRNFFFALQFGNLKAANEAIDEAYGFVDGIAGQLLFDSKATYALRLWVLGWVNEYQLRWGR